MIDEWNLLETEWYLRMSLHPTLAAAACHSDSFFGPLSTEQHSGIAVYSVLVRWFISQKNEYHIYFTEIKVVI